MTTLNPHIVRYINERQARGEITTLTATTVRQHLDTFARVYGKRPLDQLGTWAVERWLQANSHLRPSTRAVRLVTLRNFAAWLVDEGLAAKDFTRGIKRIRRPRREPRDVRLEHFVACIDACVDLREQVVVWLMYGIGLRCVEVSRLTVDDWDRLNNQLHVIGKAGHERSIPVPEIVRNVLADYVIERGSAAFGPFVENRIHPGEPVSPGRISNMAYIIIGRTGLKARPFDGFSAHGLRAAAGSDLLDACGDLRVVQQFFGHANLATTSNYLRRASLAQMRDALEARQWTPVVA